MSPARLALRSLFSGNARSILAIVLIASSLCVLDLFAGHVASERARVEYRAVVGERLGHLAILPAGNGAPGNSVLFGPDDALRVIRLAQASPGVALAAPQMRVEGIAANGARSALFFGEGIVPGQQPGARALPGKLDPAQSDGVAVSSALARALGLSKGSKLSLTGTTLDAHARTLDVTVVDIYDNSDAPAAGRRALLMPFAIAQALLDTEGSERIVIYLAGTQHAEERRLALAAALRGAGIATQIQSWQEQSSVLASERGAFDIAFDSVAGMVFAVIAATMAATSSMSVLERRREVATLRALGMRSSGIFVLFVTEALWMALAAVALSLLGSSLVAWIVNRAALTYASLPGVTSPTMLVELDFYRMGMGVLTVLAVAMLGALVPAFKAARSAIAPALAA